MFNAISLFVRQFFGMCSTLCSAGEHSAKALEHLAVTAEETAGAYCDEARANRAKQQKQLQAELDAEPVRALPARAA